MMGFSVGAGLRHMHSTLNPRPWAGFHRPIYGGMGPVEVPKDARLMFTAIATDDFLFKGPVRRGQSWFEATPGRVPPSTKTASRLWPGYPGPHRQRLVPGCSCTGWTSTAGSSLPWQFDQVRPLGGGGSPPGDQPSPQRRPSSRRIHIAAVEARHADAARSAGWDAELVLQPLGLLGRERPV